MNGRFAIRVILICSLYTILYFTYFHFSGHGYFNLRDVDGLIIIFLLFFINIAGLSGTWLLSGLISNLDPQTRAARRFIITLAVSVSWILGQSILCGWVFKILFLQNISLNEIRETYPGLIGQAILIGIFTAIIFAVLDHSLGSHKQLQTRQLEAKRMKTMQLNLRFDTLRNQISPHFLFNSLNTISSLVYRDINLAEKFIRNLASVYHSVMEHYDNPVISLDRELALVEHYSYLMQVRFENVFYLDIQFQDNPENFYVPPLSIQMLVENAIKHNRLSLETPLRVRISSEADYLYVRNNYIGNPGHIRIGEDLYRKPDKGISQGVGLQNIQNRYQLLTDRPVSVSKDEDFTVGLPLIPADEAKVLHK